MLNRHPITRTIINGMLAGGVVFALTGLFSLKSIPLLNPLPRHNDLADKIRPALMKKPNLYSVKKPASFPNTVLAASENQVASSAYAVVDYDSGEVIKENNLNEHLPIASLTKIMTAVVALDLANPDDVFTITQEAADKIPTKIGLQPGEKLTLRELMHASLLTSANDATEAIKDGVDAKYGSSVFIDAMNMKAHMLGLTSSHFANPQGFDSPANYSSVHDLAVLAHYALSEYPMIAEIVKKDYVQLPATDTHRQFDLYNWNGLLDVYPNVFGVKIGNTDAAGTTTVVASERDGHTVLVALLGTPGVLQRDMGAAQLLDMGFEEKWNMDPIAVTEDQLRAKYGTWKYWN